MRLVALLGGTRRALITRARAFRFVLALFCCCVVSVVVVECMVCECVHVGVGVCGSG